MTITPLDDPVAYCPAHTQLPDDHACDQARPLGAPVWCYPCTTRIRGALIRIPELAALTGERRDGRLNTASGDTDRTRQGTRHGSPSGSPAWDEVDDVHQWVEGWVDALTRHLGHAGPLRATNAGLPHRDLTRQVAYLTTHLSAVLSPTFAAVEFGEETLATARRLERASGRDTYVQRLPTPCPHCDLLALAREDGTEHIHCRSCGVSWAESDYRDLVAEVHQVQRERASA